MGSLRFQRLKETGAEVEGLDPKPPSALKHEPEVHTAPVAALNLARFSHIFVSTPIDHHFSVYEEIRKQFSGPVLVEKPLCIDRDQYDMMRNDTNLHLGLTERFNPRVPFHALSPGEGVQIVSLDFIRTSAGPEETPGVPIFEDLALHDLHLASQLLNERFGSGWLLSEDSSGNSASLQTETERGTLVRFLWSRSTVQKERTIVARSNRGTEFFHLSAPETQVRRRSESRPLPTVKPDPVSAEISHFLSGDLPRDWLGPHDFFIDVLGRSRQK